MRRPSTASAVARLVGLTERSRLAAAGYGFLCNKYYLDYLYEKGVVAGVVGARRQAMNWINQNVIDGVVNGVGKGAVKAAEATYNVRRPGPGRRRGQRRGQRHRGHRRGPAPVQSGKVSIYGALLFGAAAVGALILVITV